MIPGHEHCEVCGRVRHEKCKKNEVPLGLVRTLSYSYLMLIPSFILLLNVKSIMANLTTFYLTSLQGTPGLNIVIVGCGEVKGK